jgi:hypothetical protein
MEHLHGPEVERAWMRLFPDADFRLPMNLRAGDAARYWSRSDDAEAVLAERVRWIDEAPQRHFLFLDQAGEAIREAVAWLGQATGMSFVDARAAGCGVEPDWVLLSGDAERGFPVLGGAVVFPSGWGLDEKLGKSLAETHGPVPGLEPAIGGSIATFLQRLAPEAAWERDNWGLSADTALNHHPLQPYQRLTDAATLATTWMRLERQFLMRLPRTRTILFGIRVSNHRMDHLVNEFPVLVPRLVRLLTTLPEAMAAYKGIKAARGPLLEQLRLQRQHQERQDPSS